MAKNDILGTKKVRTTPEYTARTHWAGSLNFSAIFTAPVFYLLLPVLVLYVTGCFELLANAINKLAGSVIFDQYGIMGIVALLLWQVVVCWIVWCKEIKKYEDAPKYEYLFYNDIVEYKSYKPTEPKIIKVLKFLINLIPAIVIIALVGVVVFLIIDNINFNPSSPSSPSTPSTPGNSGNNGDGAGFAIEIDWKAIWDTISGVFNKIGKVISKIFNSILDFYSDKENPLILKIVVSVGVGVPVIIGLIVAIIKALDNSDDTPKSKIKMRSLPARTLPAVVSAVKKLPAPKYMVPDNCPRWLRKIIFWAPVRYNYGDVIISSPRGMDDDVILSKIESPEELINYLTPIKPQPTEVACYSANR